MNKVYLVYYNSDYYTHIDKCFDSKEKAEAYITQKYAWKEQMKQEINFDYDSWYVDDWLGKSKPMPNIAYDWLSAHNINDEINYYILERDLE